MQLLRNCLFRNEECKVSNSFRRCPSWRHVLVPFLYTEHHVHYRPTSAICLSLRFPYTSASATLMQLFLSRIKNFTFTQTKKKKNRWGSWAFFLFSSRICRDIFLKDRWTLLLIIELFYYFLCRTAFFYFHAFWVPISLTGVEQNCRMGSSSTITAGVNKSLLLSACLSVIKTFQSGSRQVWLTDIILQSTKFNC